MPKPRTGQVRIIRGKPYARIRVGRARVSFELAAEIDHAARTSALVQIAAASVDDETGRALLARAALATTDRELAAIRTLAEQRAAGAWARTVEVQGVTYQQLSERWTSGELAKLYPDHVRQKRTAENDAQLSAKHIYDVAGDVPVARFSLDDAERVMRLLSRDLSPATRRHVAQLMHRVLALAVFPLRLREAHPLPRGWLPSVGSAKAGAYLYPDEDVRLLACPAVPLAMRVLYGVLAREGMRRDEACSLRWRDVDLERGVVTLDENKTDEPRAWVLGQDVARALALWRQGAPTAAPVFGDATPRADALRRHLEAAGVARPQLFERSAARKPIRVHDLRATFVTLALAAGRSEAWVSDRTGHRSSTMIRRYQRAARSAAELRLGWLAPLDTAVPELAEWAAVRAAGGSGSGERGVVSLAERAGFEPAEPLQAHLISNRAGRAEASQVGAIAVEHATKRSSATEPRPNPEALRPIRSACDLGIEALAKCVAGGHNGIKATREETRKR